MLGVITLSVVILNVMAPTTMPHHLASLFKAGVSKLQKGSLKWPYYTCNMVPPSEILILRRSQDSLVIATLETFLSFFFDEKVFFYLSCKHLIDAAKWHFHWRPYSTYCSSADICVFKNSLSSH